MAPADLSLATNGPSLSALLPARWLKPKVVGVPATRNCSLIVMGTPCNGPSASPRLRASSAAFASARARSKRRTTTALSCLSTSSTLAMWASTTSRAETWPSRITAARSVAPAPARGELASRCWSTIPRTSLVPPAPLFGVSTTLSCTRGHALSNRGSSWINQVARKTAVDTERTFT